MALILIVDDEEHVRLVLQRFLEREGHEVVHAAEGETAVRLYRETPVDLVITDIVMPRKDGLATISEIKEYDAEAKIIAISGGGRSDPESLLTSAFDMGADNVLSKPFSRNALLSAVTELLGDSK